MITSLTGLSSRVAVLKPRQLKRNGRIGLVIAESIFFPARNYKTGKGASYCLTAIQYRANTNRMFAERFVSVNLKKDDENPNQNSTKGLNFENHTLSFKGKSTWEILRALFVLKMCSVNMVVNNSLSIMNWTQKWFGRRTMRALVKPMFYKQFVGGETRAEIQECMRKLSDVGIRPILAVTLEEECGDGRDEEVYESNTERILQCLEISAAETMLCPMMQLKMTGLLPANLLILLGDIYESEEDKLKFIRAVASGLIGSELDVTPFSVVLDEKQLTIFRAAILRLKRIGEDARSRSVKVQVDAEYTYMNHGLSLLTMAMVSAFNKDTPVIWNTYQCYLKKANSKLKEELALADQMNVCFGAKLVRGAYIVQERARAERLQLVDPICDDYEATNQNYNKILTSLLEKVTENWPRYAVIVASHNEESVKLATKIMNEKGINIQNGCVCFGQLYGMGDLITYPLATLGYAVYKSIPYGTVEEVVPYLARRATENTSVLEGTKKERHYLRKELKRRANPKNRRRSSR